jgi:hypothetical protein
MEQGIVNIIERVGSLGLLGWLLVWATGTAWPKVSSHLDVVSEKLDRIGDQLTGLRQDISELRNTTMSASGGGGAPPSTSAASRRRAVAATGGGR